MIVLKLALALALLPGGERVPDRIDLVNGKSHEGRILYEDAQTLLLLSGTREREFQKTKIKRTTSRAKRHRAAILRWIGLPPEDLEGVVALAERCKQDDLLEEMRLLALQALVMEPDCRAARALLGHEETPEGWMVPDSAAPGGKMEWNVLLASHGAFEHPWELESAHYRVRTNLTLRKALEAALALECHYLALHDAFGRVLRLREVLEPLRADLHGDIESFPPIASGRKAYFLPETRTLVVWAWPRPDLRTLMHEATHATLYGAAGADAAGRASLPAWLDEGLAVYMESALIGLPGKLMFDRPTAQKRWYRLHAQERGPYDLARLLTFESADFLASTRTDLKYAQAFTLLDFLAHAEGGKHREGLAGFVRGTYAGQSSQAHLREALGIEDAALERAWQAHVQIMAR